ncbi:MAG: hypothetical protein A2126_00350 [Candidatus Woykebacteria bacterium GWB1_45_5]|uniref:Uncharacterized protein n=2 Tax=Candidatus Woykeibacteriota TaxID=1817899 RepID=A0A1G1W2D3_9BACT|nr:MAG: hypothetical protein A2113_00735 [Candidatus Woykebacteria bacterium GWA1_44_8]OGY22822.1 MAG: hypothetical protein A2126_00350 [Candidatus Woykebacteria bacterium GWB1_45_5]
MTLAEFSAFIRRSARWFLISIAVLFLLWLVWIFIRATSGFFIQPKGEDTAFGKLAIPFFVKSYSFIKAGRYELDTSLPKQQEKALVYEFNPANKFSEQQTSKIASFLGFTESSQKKVGATITWGSTSGQAYLKLNTATSHFTYRYNFSKEDSDLEKISFTEKEALAKTKEILQQLGLLPEDISKGASIARYLKISGSKQEKVAEGTANALEVSLFRKVGNSTSNGDAPIRFLFGASLKILEFDYNYSPLDPVGSPYPIISGQAAWNSFQEGKAYTSTRTDFDSIIVTKISLSYWESALPQKYIQPVWLFVGKGKTDSQEEEFTAVYTAISQSFLSE